MIVVSISNWRKKVIIIASILLIASVLSIGFSYHKDSTAAVELEEILQDPVTSGMENVEGTNNLEQEFEEKELTKGFLEKILEKFRKE